MNSGQEPAVAVTVLFVVGLVVFRLLWGASQLAAVSAFGRVKLPKSWQRWLFGTPSQPASK